MKTKNKDRIFACSKIDIQKIPESDLKLIKKLLDISE